MTHFGQLRTFLLVVFTRSTLPIQTFYSTLLSYSYNCCALNNKLTDKNIEENQQIAH